MEEAPTPTRTVTDMLGRQVEIPVSINRIICNGSNALRMVSYLQATDLLVGVEETNQDYADSTKCDYAYVYHDTFQELPVIGKDGGTAHGLPGGDPEGTSRCDSHLLCAGGR